MKHIESMMHFYDLALDELMDAQKYQKLSHSAEDADAKRLFHELALQELQHEKMLCEKAEAAAMAAGATEEVHEVWHHLKHHLAEWREDIKKKLS